jgi:hypothetical protein
VAFTNFADPTGHVTATVNGAAAPIVVEAVDGGATFSVTPPAGAAWPPGATVVITVDAATTNLLDQPIAAAATATFTVP